VKGVTGARKALPDDIVHQVQTLKSMTDLPVCVGFGISTASQVDNILTFADGVIVGSFLMERIMQAEDPVAAAGDTLLRLSG
jgi:tryptophan synthase alpha chain